jgi:hypothetical protein
LAINYNYLRAIFFGGFFSRLVHQNSYFPAVLSGVESSKRILELIKNKMEIPREPDFYLVKLPRSKIEKGVEAERLKKMEEKWVLDCNNKTSSSLTYYNPLYDDHLNSFFSNNVIRKQLKQKGFINTNGWVMYDANYRNMLAFYTYTDITKASNYLDTEFNVNNEYLGSSFHKYISFASGPVKFMNKEYKQAKEFMNKTMDHKDLSHHLQAFNLHNLALVNIELKREYELLDNQFKEAWKKNNEYDEKEIEITEKKSLVLYKQALAKLELENGETIEEEAKKLLFGFLYSESNIPTNLNEQQENVLIQSFKNPYSGITITNVAEMFFEKGKEFEKVIYIVESI